MKSKTRIVLGIDLLLLLLWFWFGWPYLLAAAAAGATAAVLEEAGVIRSEIAWWGTLLAVFFAVEWLATR